MLLIPGNQTPFSGDNAQVVVQWQTKDGLPAGAVYRVTFEWTEGGVPVNHTPPGTTSTSMRVPLWLFGKADQPARQYHWSVQVVQVTTDGKGGERVIELSPPSPRWIFYWN